MTTQEFDFLMYDRIEKIIQIITRYNENNFYISFSGGRDSTVLRDLIDRAIPHNNIPSVHINTGIELKSIEDFVKKCAERDDRVKIIKPQENIKKVLSEYGYPFKSKMHSKILSQYQRGVNGVTIHNYLADNQRTTDWSSFRTCPKILKYQFTPDFNIKVSDKCCEYLKEKPLKKWSFENAKPFAIIGVMRSEGGRRETANCLAFRNNKLTAFQPLAPLPIDFIDEYVKYFNIEIADVYNPPYNFTRTGCKGCPFAIGIENELRTLKKYFPVEHRQCMQIWGAVYNEYYRIGYRIKDKEVIMNGSHFC